MVLSSGNRLLCLALLTLAACSEPPDISAQVEEYGILISTSLLETCDCALERGYDSVSECDAAFGSVNYECQHSVLRGHEETADEYLGCAIPAADAYVTCLEADPGCEPGWFDACNEVWVGAEAKCPQLSSGLATELANCVQ